MILSATAVREELVDISIGNAAIVALMGYLVVFFGIVLLKNPMLPAIRARYLRYPAFVEAVADRHERYNETLSYISMLEQSGKDYVIRPPIPLEIGAMERDPDQLRRVYETGRAVAQIQVDKIRAFLETAKAEAEE